jgi:hypothetical protein
MGNYLDSNKRLSLGEAGNNAFAALSAAKAHDSPDIGEQSTCYPKHLYCNSRLNKVSLTDDPDIYARGPNNNPAWNTSDPSDSYVGTVHWKIRMLPGNTRHEVSRRS